MRQKENNFTGFIVRYDDGNQIVEKNNYFSTKTDTKKATNWHEVDRGKISSLELFWRGESKIKLNKKDFPDIKPSDWYFSHFGCLDMDTHETRIIARNIGVVRDSILTLYSVSESTGIVKVEHRPHT